MIWTCGLLVTMVIQVVTAGCPKQCRCSLKEGRKFAICSDGGLLLIPTTDMDYNTHVIIVTAPPGKPNNFTIGRIFFKFPNLEIVRVTHSNVPAIGDSSFWPGRRVRILDLSHNSIRFLRETDFNGLINLRELYLDNNRISATPSAPFRYLSSLTKLVLANNELKTLVPRFFYLLTNLKELDLSDNPLQVIDADNVQDVRSLKILKLARCAISRLHPHLYQQLPDLRDLDLQDNLVSSIAPEEYRHLGSLKSLWLDGNRLTKIPDNAFYGHVFRYLGLSRNEIKEISQCTFCNATITSLDLSKNKLGKLSSDMFEPLATYTEYLNLNTNFLGTSSLLAAIQPLQSLKTLHAANSGIEQLPGESFRLNHNINLLDLSHNNLKDVPAEIFQPLSKIAEIDMSYNAFSHVESDLLQALSNLTNLEQIRFDGNPFNCMECDIFPFLTWLNATRFFNESCNNGYCLTCASPDEMSGQLLHMVGSSDLGSCLVGFGSLRSLAYASKTGMLVAIAIIVVILIIIIITIYVYRRHIAHYYTNEDRQHGCKGVYNNPALGGLTNDDLSARYVAAQRKPEANVATLGNS